MPRGTRPATVDIGARSRKLDRGLREANRKLKRFGGKAAKDINRSFSGVKRSLSTLAGFAGIGAFGAMAKGAFDFEKQLTRLGIAGGRSSAELSALRTQLRKLSNDTGVAAADLLGGVERFVATTGNFDAGVASVETFAKVVQASGATMEDVAQTAASLQATFGLDPTQFEQAFSIILTAGKEGSIELKDLASQLGTVARQFTQFGNSGTQGLAELSAAFQVLAPDFGFRAAETTTGLQSFLGTIEKNAKKIKKQLGFDVKGPDGKLKGITELVKLFGDSKNFQNGQKLFDALGRKEAVTTIRALVAGYDRLQELTATAADSQAVQEDFLRYQQSAAGRMERAWERLKNKIAEAVTPERIDKFARAMEIAADIVAFLADNIVAVGVALLAMKLGPGIISLIKFVRELKGAGGLKTLLGGADGAVGKAGSAFGVAAAAALGIGIGRYIDNKLGISDSLAPGAEHNDVATVAGKRAAAADLERAARERTVRVEKNQSGWGRFGSFAKAAVLNDPLAGSRFEYKAGGDGFSPELALAQAKKLREEANAQAARERQIAEGRRIESQRFEEAENERLIKISLEVKKNSLIDAQATQERRARK